MCVAVLALVPRALTAGRFETTDETLWMQRSLNFSDALLRLDPARASATTDVLSTMPGVTTMWIGSAARATRWIGARLGLVEGDVAFTASPAGLHFAQLGVAFASSALIGVVVLLAWQWASPVAAVTAGALLASEPFVVAHGSVLHTDELTGLFGAAGMLALLSALAIPAPVTERPRAMAAVGGMLLGGSLLTKLSALSLLPGLAAVIGAALLYKAREGWRSGSSLADAVRTPARLLLLAAASAAVTILVAWPAIWADPLHQFGLLQESAALARTPHTTFFLGQPTTTPGRLYYAVATPLRMTPWFLLGSLLLIPLGLARRRRHMVILLVVIASIAAVLTTAARQMDRYVLTALPLLALACGLGLDVAVGPARAWFDTRPRLAIAAGLAATALLVLHASWIAPWGLAYFNPLLGGSATAEQAILVGWGEGLELAGERIRQREAPRCDLKVALKYWVLSSAFPCGSTTPEVDGADYLVLYVNHRQRLSEPALTDLRRRGRLIDVVSIRGIDYAEIYDLRPASANVADRAVTAGEEARRQ